jgi:hypothetical protein
LLIPPPPSASTASSLSTSSGRLLHALPLHQQPPPTTSSTPHVTISNAVGSVVQYHPFPSGGEDVSALHELDLALAAAAACNKEAALASNRSWRSHSLTPLGQHGGGQSISPASSTSSSGLGHGLCTDSEWNKQGRK